MINEVMWNRVFIIRYPLILMLWYLGKLLRIDLVLRKKLNGIYKYYG